MSRLDMSVHSGRSASIDVQRRDSLQSQASTRNNSTEIPKRRTSAELCYARRSEELRAYNGLRIRSGQNMKRHCMDQEEVVLVKKASCFAMFRCLSPFPGRPSAPSFPIALPPVSTVSDTVHAVLTEARTGNDQEKDAENECPGPAQDESDETFVPRDFCRPQGCDKPPKTIEALPLWQDMSPAPAGISGDDEDGGWRGGELASTWSGGEISSNQR
jgi:hypothetical protein